MLWAMQKSEIPCTIYLESPRVAIRNTSKQVGFRMNQGLGKKIEIE